MNCIDNTQYIYTHTHIYTHYQKKTRQPNVFTYPIKNPIQTRARVHTQQTVFFRSHNIVLGVFQNICIGKLINPVRKSLTQSINASQSSLTQTQQGRGSRSKPTSITHMSLPCYGIPCFFFEGWGVIKSLYVLFVLMLIISNTTRAYTL